MIDCINNKRVAIWSPKRQKAQGLSAGGVTNIVSERRQAFGFSAQMII